MGTASFLLERKLYMVFILLTAKMIAKCLERSFITSFQPDNGDLSKFNLILDRYEKVKKTLSRKAGQQKIDGTLPNDNLSKFFRSSFEVLSKFFNISHEDALS